MKCRHSSIQCGRSLQMKNKIEKHSRLKKGRYKNPKNVQELDDLWCKLIAF